MSSALIKCFMMFDCEYITNETYDLRYDCITSEVYVVARSISPFAPTEYSVV